MDSRENLLTLKDELGAERRYYRYGKTDDDDGWSDDTEEDSTNNIRRATVSRHRQAHGSKSWGDLRKVRKSRIARTCQPASGPPRNLGLLETLGDRLSTLSVSNTAANFSSDPDDLLCQGQSGACGSESLLSAVIPQSQGSKTISDSSPPLPTTAKMGDGEEMETSQYFGAATDQSRQTAGSSRQRSDP